MTVVPDHGRYLQQPVLVAVVLAFSISKTQIGHDDYNIITITGHFSPASRRNVDDDFNGNDHTRTTRPYRLRRKIILGRQELTCDEICWTRKKISIGPPLPYSHSSPPPHRYITLTIDNTHTTATTRALGPWLAAAATTSEPAARFLVCLPSTRITIIRNVMLTYRGAWVRLLRLRLW